jgi:hypothetical protein
VRERQPPQTSLPRDHQEPDRLVAAMRRGQLETTPQPWPHPQRRLDHHQRMRSSENTPKAAVRGLPQAYLAADGHRTVTCDQIRDRTAHTHTNSRPKRPVTDTTPSPRTHPQKSIAQQSLDGVASLSGVRCGRPIGPWPPSGQSGEAGLAGGFPGARAATKGGSMASWP